MTWAEFAARVREALGPDLQAVRPERVHEFLAALREELEPTPREDEAVVLPEGPSEGYDEILRSFFSGVLDRDADSAAIDLWMHAFEAWCSETAADGGRVWDLPAG
jgi:hypothetical protein